jgi:arylsulfatase A-like enzyme
LFAFSLVGKSEDTRPNIILILSDDHTWTHYGFMGHPEVQTPHLDRMADESLLYTRGYVSPVCSPSLASLLTGLPPRQHGITGNDLKNQRGDRLTLQNRLKQNSLLLPEALSEAGYLPDG